MTARRHAVLIRSAHERDVEAIARVQTLSWQSAYRGLLSDDYLDAMDWTTRAQRWARLFTEPVVPGVTVHVAVDESDAIQGFVHMAPARDEDLAGQSLGELFVIYLAPAAWHQGIGGRLVQAGFDAMPAGTSGVVVWVFRGNDRARRFYARHGFAADGSSQMLSIGDREIEEIRYRLPLTAAGRRS